MTLPYVLFHVRVTVLCESSQNCVGKSPKLLLIILINFEEHVLLENLIAAHLIKKFPTFC
jgi:hypothetical protein